MCVSFGGCRCSFLVCRLSLVARYPSFVACCLLVVMGFCLLGVVCGSLCVVCWLLFVVCFVAVCGSLFVVCCVLLAV